MLCGPPLLDALYILDSRTIRGSTQGHPPPFASKSPQPRAGFIRSSPWAGLLPSVPLKHRSWLPGNAPGRPADNDPPTVAAAIQHVLGGIDTHRITVAAPGISELLTRFEGPWGSLG